MSTPHPSHVFPRLAGVRPSVLQRLERDAQDALGGARQDVALGVLIREALGEPRSPAKPMARPLDGSVHRADRMAAESTCARCGHNKAAHAGAMRGCLLCIAPGGQTRCARFIASTGNGMAEERLHCGCPVKLRGHLDTCPTALAGVRFDDDAPPFLPHQATKEEILAALARLPKGRELTPHERARMDDGRAAVARGERGIPHEVVMATIIQRAASEHAEAISGFLTNPSDPAVRAARRAVYERALREAIDEAIAKGPATAPEIEVERVAGEDDPCAHPDDCIVQIVGTAALTCRACMASMAIPDPIVVSESHTVVVLREHRSAAPLPAGDDGDGEEFGEADERTMAGLPDEPDTAASLDEHRAAIVSVLKGRGGARWPRAADLLAGVKGCMEAVGQAFDEHLYQRALDALKLTDAQWDGLTAACSSDGANFDHRVGQSLAERGYGKFGDGRRWRLFYANEAGRERLALGRGPR